MTKTFFPVLQNYVEAFSIEWKDIPEERKEILKKLASFVKEKVKASGDVNLIFICTHNSRRSHISQIWAQAASHYYNIPQVYCYSGGTEATAFNPRAVKAMRKAGFKISIVNESDNPVYKVEFAEGQSLKAFSKKYDDPANPQTDFAAIMTCSHADDNCPYIPGASARIPLTYNDPKDYDGTEMEEEKYDERCKQIGREIFYAFSLI